MKKGQEEKEVLISSQLYNRITERVKTTGFGSVDEYVTFVLEEVLKEDEEEKVSSQNEEEVKKRLRALGYLD